MEVSGQLHVPTDLFSGKKKIPDTVWIWGWIRQRGILVVLKKKNSVARAENQTPVCPARNVVTAVTDYEAEDWIRPQSGEEHRTQGLYNLNTV